MWAFVQALRKLKIDKGDVLYFEGDFSEEIYFIKQGKVKLFASNGYPYLNFKDGQNFGEVEVFFREQRKGKAIAQTDCLLYTLERDDLQSLLE
jgi:CRP-like cAMP-binding protein